MPAQAIFFGSIGTIAETSDIQRRAYNQALNEAGVAWEWEPDTYRELLRHAGGKRRLERLSAAEGGLLTQAQIHMIHARKTEIACAEIARGVELRPGVAEHIEQALIDGVALALVTSTYSANIEAIASGAGYALPLERFAAVVTVEDCARGKPAPDPYLHALERLGIDPAIAVAIEDSAASVSSAKAAGLYTIATPGEYTAGQDFSAADRVLGTLSDLTPEALRSR